MIRSDFGRRAILWSVAALFTAMLADLAEALIDPISSGEGADVVVGTTEHHGRTVLAAILLLASAAFLTPAVFGLARRLEHRGRGIGRAAMVLALLGTLGHAALGGVYLFWAAMPAQGGNNAELVAAIDRANGAGSVAVLFPLLIAFPVSLVVFFVAMVRGRIAPLWVLVPALAAPVAAIVGGSDAAATATALALLLVAASALAVRLLGEPRNQARPLHPSPATVHEA
jgi:hypothetical protein